MTYEYECKTCGQRFEKQQRVTEAPLASCECPQQGPVRRVVSGGLGILLTPSSSSGSSSGSERGSCCGGSCGCRD